MEKKIFAGIDIFKLICAILIAFMHCYCFESWGSTIKNILSPIGVPFFFIVSGFFYTEGLYKSKEPRKYLKRYLIRITQMYIAWTILTLPVAWYNLGHAHSDYSPLLKVIYIIRCFFFTGSIGIYWYLLALIYNSFILYYSYTKGKDAFIYITAIIFFIIGLFYESGLIENTLLAKVIHVVIGSERNFLNVGLFYMCVGYYLSKNKLRDVKSIYHGLLLIISIVATYYLYPIFKFHFLQAINAILLFSFSYSIILPKCIRSTYHIRKLSTAIYLGHFPFILLFDYYLKRGTIIDVTAALTFSIILYYLIVKLFPNKISTIFYG